MKQRDNIYKQLKIILESLLLKIEKFDVQSFDYDSDFQNILKDNNVNFDYGIIKPIYFLVDIIYDSISHSFKEVNEGYTYDDAKNDIKYIISCIDNNNIKLGLEKTKGFYQSLNVLFLREN